MQNVWSFADCWRRPYDPYDARHGDGPPAPAVCQLRRSPGASEQIALEIRRYLEEQRLQPGERIGTEQELADEFGVSRPTLREALRLLSASQLIRVGRGRSGGDVRRPHARARG